MSITSTITQRVRRQGENDEDKGKRSILNCHQRKGKHKINKYKQEPDYK